MLKNTILYVRCEFAFLLTNRRVIYLNHPINEFAFIWTAGRTSNSKRRPFNVNKTRKFTFLWMGRILYGELGFYSWVVRSSLIYSLSAFFLLVNCEREQFELLAHKKNNHWIVNCIFQESIVCTQLRAAYRMMNIVSTQFFDLFYFFIESHTQFATIISCRILEKKSYRSLNEMGKKIIAKFISFFCSFKWTTRTRCLFIDKYNDTFPKNPTYT